jgi:hypothetical protein
LVLGQYAPLCDAAAATDDREHADDDIRQQVCGTSSAADRARDGSCVRGGGGGESELAAAVGRLDARSLVDSALSLSEALAVVLGSPMPSAERARRATAAAAASAASAARSLVDAWADADARARAELAALEGVAMADTAELHPGVAAIAGVPHAQSILGGAQTLAAHERANQVCAIVTAACARADDANAAHHAALADVATVDEMESVASLGGLEPPVSCAMAILSELLPPAALVITERAREETKPGHVGETTRVTAASEAWARIIATLRATIDRLLAVGTPLPCTAEQVRFSDCLSQTYATLGAGEAARDATAAYSAHMSDS